MGFRGLGFRLIPRPLNEEPFLGCPQLLIVGSQPLEKVILKSSSTFKGLRSVFVSVGLWGLRFRV